MLLGQGQGRCRITTVTVGMTDHEPVEAAHAALGGRLKKQRKQSPQNDMYIWSVSGTRALDLLEAVRPYLVIERRQALADLLIHEPVLRSTRRGPGNSKKSVTDSLFSQMQDLNAQRNKSLGQQESHTPTEDDLEYMAAIIDGEGHVRKQDGVVEVSSTDPELLSWVRARFGGRTYGPRVRRVGLRPLWVWAISPNRFRYAEEVASKMMLERKRDLILGRGDARDAHVPIASLATPSDGNYLDLRGEGLLRAVAVRESGISLGRAKWIDDHGT